MHRRRLNISLLLVVVICQFFVAVVTSAATENLKTAIARVTTAQADSFSQIAADITTLIPDPDSTVKAADAGDPELKKAFHYVHCIYTDHFSKTLPRISWTSENAFADEFFVEFFAPEDNQPAHMEKLAKIADRLKPHFSRKNLQVKPGVLSGGGIIGFAKGGEWVVLTDEIADWPTDQVAAIMAHEISHLQKRDFVKIMLIRQLNGELVKLFPENSRAGYKKILDLFAARWQRYSEYEADAQAVQLMKKAGFDPAGMLQVLKHLADESESSANYLYREHPSTAQRSAAVKRLLK